MGLDVYVMPIWRFKAGDFASPIEALGIRPIIMTPDGSAQHLREKRAGPIRQWRAKRATRRLRLDIQAKIGHTVRWNDQGDVVYTRQSHGFEALRAFAKWIDYRDLFPTFEAAPKNNYYEHPVMSEKLDRPATYPQTVDHSCFSGYYLPADLERVVYVEPFPSWGGIVFTHSVGSSISLLKELQQLSELLNIDGESKWDKKDPLAEVKASFSQLYEVAKISIKQDLPIVFYG
jgi:hypothetical protein